MLRHWGKAGGRAGSRWMILIEFRSWRNSAVTKGAVINGSRCLHCPYDPLGTAMDRIEFPAELPLHIQSPWGGGQRGGCQLGTWFCFPREGKNGLAPNQNPGGWPWKSKAGVQGGERLGWLGREVPTGGSGPGLRVTSFPSCPTSSCCHCRLLGPCHPACQLRWSVWHCCLGCRHSGGSRARAAG